MNERIEASPTVQGRATRSTRKKDAAPRGVFRHPSGVWAARFTCGAGHIHQERVGPLKSDAIRVYHDRRARAHDEPGWCPATERCEARERARREHQRARQRVTFAEYAKDYLAWSKANKRSWQADGSRLKLCEETFGVSHLDEITPATLERFLDRIRERRTPATRNRYLGLLGAMFNRAVRLGLVERSPMRGIARATEPGGRIACLDSEAEGLIRDALPAEVRDRFTVAVHSGLRYSEQDRLTWRDVDALAGSIAVALSKNGRRRQIPMNSVVRSVLLDLATRRSRPDDPSGHVFPGSGIAGYRRATRALQEAVEAAQGRLREAGRDTSRLDGFTWHGLRHTFASRLVMAGVDLRTVQELGGWRSVVMVQRYSHLSAGHLQAAVERLVPAGTGASARTIPEPSGGVELRRNLDGAAEAMSGARGGVS